MVIQDLEHVNVTASFDEKTRIAVITYRGELGADATEAAYEWLEQLTRAIGIENLHGEIFDFRQVTQFLPDNLMAARKNSRRMNMRNDVQNLPVALIVKDFVQEEIMRVPMRNVPGNVRKTIVRTPEDAYRFIEEWHNGGE